MKQCAICHKIKPLSEFYQSKNRIEYRCKSCKNKYGKKRYDNFGKANHEPLMLGKRVCIVCLKKKSIRSFHVNRTRVGGREQVCGSCQNEIRKTKKLSAGNVYLPPNGIVDSRATYHTGKCEICNSPFLMMRSSHKRCESCSSIVRDLQSHLSGSRHRNSEKQMLRITAKEAVVIAKKYVSTSNCIYCNREFTDNNPKSTDHIVPVVAGGANTLDNINICCLQCNFSKGKLSLDEWFALCQLVAANVSK